MNRSRPGRDGPTAVLYDDAYKLHQTGGDHPESPERLGAILDGLARAGLDKVTRRLAPRPATEQEVAACHTGNRSCFYRVLTAEGGNGIGSGDRRFDPTEVYRGFGILASLFAVIEERRQARPAGSYVASLFATGEDQIRKKVAEEAAEVLLASKGANRAQVVYEMADLWFHSLVLLAQHGIRPEEIAGELGRRSGTRKAEYGSPAPQEPAG